MEKNCIEEVLYDAKEKNYFTQLCCLKHYSAVCARKFEFIFDAMILYYGNVFVIKYISAMNFNSVDMMLSLEWWSTIDV